MSGLFGRGYPGGDTSKTVVYRAYSNTTTAIGTGDTVIPVFETEDLSAGPLTGFTKISNTVLQSSGRTKNITGVLNFNVVTTGSGVEFSTWLESSTDNVTWAPVANSLRVNVITTDATVDVGGPLVGPIQAGVYIRVVAQRTGGTTCNIQQSTHAAATGNVSQPAAIIKVYGI